MRRQSLLRFFLLFATFNTQRLSLRRRRPLSRAGVDSPPANQILDRISR